MKKFVIQGVLLIIVIFTSLYLATSKNTNLPFFPQPTNSSEIFINDQKFIVEIADTKEKRSKGLGDREVLASDSGMLFVFDKEDKYSFWMKGLKFPIDFIWIKDETIVDIIKNALPPIQNQQDKDLPIYIPNQPINMVLEVNAGFVDRYQIKVGGKVKF